MTRVLLSPSETALAKKLKDEAITSPLPELKGADILIYSKHGLLGIQRKEVPHDFISSFTDGRMARETSLLTKHCKYRTVLCEGRFRFYPNQVLVTDQKAPSRFTRKHIRGMQFDIKYVKGVDIDYTDDIDDTINFIRSTADLLDREKHLGLYSRPSAQGAWYVPAGTDIDLWLLQSFPGIGPAIASNIIERFGGKVPMAWTCTLEELTHVPRLTAKKARELWSQLPGGVSASKLDDLKRRLGR